MNSVLSGHLDIQEERIRLQCFDLFPCILGAARHTCDLHFGAVCFEHHPQVFPCVGFIINYQCAHAIMFGSGDKLDHAM